MMQNSGRNALFFTLMFLGLVSVAGVFTPGRVQAKAQPIQRSWTYHFEAVALNGVSSDAEKVFVATAEAHIEAVGLKNGEKLWATDLGGELVSNLLPGTASVFVVTRSLSAQNSARAVQVRSISKDTGITSWSSSLTESGPFYLGVVAGKLVVVSAKGRIVALNTVDGREIWNTKIADDIPAEPAFGPDRFAVSAGNSKVLILAGQSGTIEESIEVPFALSTLAFNGDRGLLWGDERGNLVAYDLDEDATLWKFKSGGRISKVLLTGAYLLAASLDNFVYLIDPGSGRVRWKKRQNGQPKELAAFSDGKSLVVSDIAGESLNILSLRSGKALDQLLPASENDFIRLGVITYEMLITLGVDGIAAYRTRDIEK
jgi:outer membrane protein assembly factor BamB